MSYYGQGRGGDDYHYGSRKYEDQDGSGFGGGVDRRSSAPDTSRSASHHSSPGRDGSRPGSSRSDYSGGSRDSWPDRTRGGDGGSPRRDRGGEARRDGRQGYGDSRSDRVDSKSSYYGDASSATGQGGSRYNGRLGDPDQDRYRGRRGEPERYGGRQGEPERYEPEVEPGVAEQQQRIQAAYRRMEDSSAKSLRTLHETLDVGIGTTEELERQAESLDRTERRLDEIEVDLDQSKKHMRNIKSVFGGVGNYFARRKDIKTVTDPKIPASSARRTSGGGGGGASAKAKGKREGDGGRDQPQGTGSEVVDRNMEEMERALHQMKGVGLLISDQLDDSDAQIDRVRFKMDRGTDKVKKINKDIERQL